MRRLSWSRRLPHFRPASSWWAASSSKTETQRLEAVHQRELVSEKAESLRRRDAVSRVNLAYREYLDDNVALADELLAGCPADLREWEWDYAQRLGHSELKSFSGSSQGQDVWSIAFSPDCALLACGFGSMGLPGRGSNGRIDRARRADRRGGLRTSRSDRGGPGRGILARRAPPRGVMGIRPAGIERRCWPFLTSRAAAKRGRSRNQALTSSALPILPTADRSPAGCGSFNDFAAVGFARLRDATTGEPIGQPIAGGPGGVLCVAFSPDGRQIALASRDAADICDLSSPARPLVHQLRGHVNFIYAIAFSPDGGRVATGGWDKTIRLWDRATGEHLQTLIGHRGFVRGLAFSADGTQLVSGSEDKSVRRWDLAGRRGKRRVSRAHRLCPLRRLWARRHSGGLREPGRDGQALAGRQPRTPR